MQPISLPGAIFQISERGAARVRSRRGPLIRGLVGVLVVLLIGAQADAFTLGDHAVKAFIRPAPLVAAYEAESCAGDVAATEDAGAANGKAILLKTDGPALTFTQELERGTYVLWTIARSDTPPSRYREPVFLELRVTGADVPQRQWRMRVNYEGRYQDVSHMYVDIHAPGTYTFALSLGAGSQFGMYVDRLELRDELKNTWKRGYKDRATVFLEPAPLQAPEAAYSDAQIRDLAVRLAASLPPRNTLLASGGMPKEGYYQEFNLGDARTAEPTAGRWLWQIDTPLDQPWVFTGPLWPVRDEIDDLLEETEAAAADDGLGGGLATSATMSQAGFGVAPPKQRDINWGTSALGKTGRYTAENFARFEKLPGRWPDDGNGYFIPKGTIGIADNRYFNNVAVEFKGRYTRYRSELIGLADEFYETGNTNVGIRAALMVIFFADAFPSLDNTVQGTANVTWGGMPFNDFSGNDAGVTGKLDYSGWAANANLPVVLAYDKVFPMIHGNQALADAVHEVIPWVKTPEDVIELVDVKLVQHLFDVADRGIVRFATGLRCDPIVAVVQGDNEAGRAMLQRILFETSPQHPSLLDGIVVRLSRDTTSYIGSMFYAKGPSMEAGQALVNLFEHDSGVDLAKADLPLSSLHQSARWLYEPYVAGVHIPGVGDVSGPRGYPAMVIGDPGETQRMLLGAWRQFGDTEFAWLMKHVYGLPQMPAEELARVETAAAAYPGDPRKIRGSRVLEGFGAAILEANPEETDYRKRTGLVLRAGYGSGHGHADQLNIELFDFGIPMVPEFGGRGGYGTPETGAAQSHCLVSVDGRVAGTGQVRWLADMPGVQVVDAVGGKISRTVALVKVSADASYVVDFSRASGGSQRTYYFHGQQTETLDQEAAAAAATGIEAMVEPDGLDELGADILEDAKPKTAWKWNDQVFSDSVTGPALKPKEPYHAVWPLGRPMEDSIYSLIAGRHRFADGQKPEPIEASETPRKYTRLLLLPAATGRSLQRFTAVSEQVIYRIPCVGITEKREAAETSRFTAVIETFAGKPAVLAVRPLPVTPADGRAVALAIDLPGGRTDLYFQSDAPEQRYTVGGTLPFTVSGEFAQLRYQGQELVACGVVGGSELTAGQAKLGVSSPSLKAVIESVDFRENRIVLDRVLPLRPADMIGSSWQIGQDGEIFVVDRVEQTEGHTVLHSRKGAEAYRSPLFLAADGEVVGTMEIEARIQHGWLTDETRQRGWAFDRIAIGKYRWMGTSFRGGAHMGGPLSWDRIPDADGDGKRTLTIGAHDSWTEDMTAEVLTVDENLRAFYFRPLKSPAGYAGTRSYANAPITNEKGEHISTTMMPGKPTSFFVSGAVSAEDFSDANGDGVVRLHVYYYGPGDPVYFPSAVGLEKHDGQWRGRGSVDWDFTAPDK